MQRIIETCEHCEAAQATMLTDNGNKQLCEACYDELCAAQKKEAPQK